MSSSSEETSTPAASSAPTSPPLSNLSIKSETDGPQSLGDVTDEAKAEAEKLKAEANKVFAEHDYLKAATLYSAAIDKNAFNHILFANRAMARIRLEEHGLAIADASRSIELNDKYAKAYFRRASAYLAILNASAAIADFKKALALEPNNKQTRAQLDATTKLHRRIQFEKAIAADEEELASDKVRKLIADGAGDIEASYEGPRLETDPETGKFKPTEAFVDEMIDHFKAGKALHKRVAWEIVLGTREVLVNEPSLVEAVVEDGCTLDVIGDTHGQFYDLLNLVEKTGRPCPTHALLFNGDFVDRGSWSTEVVLLLFLWKWLYPNRVFLNRGNHETNDMNKVYGFEGEVKHKYSDLTFKLFSDVFTTLPIATLVSPTLPPTSTTPNDFLSPEGRKRYFVVHGGLFSKDGVTLDDIRAVKRFGRQPGQEGIMCEALWTDPQESNGRGPSKRGVGVGFGPDVTRDWCKLNSVTAVLRSHEVRQEGYAVEHDGRCITVFSAPNYVDSTGNKGAFVRIDADGTLHYNQFEAVPHPPIRPMAYSSGFSGLMG